MRLCWLLVDDSGLQRSRTLVMEISSQGVDIMSTIRRVIRYRQMKKWVTSKSKYGASIAPHGKMRKKDVPRSGNGKTGSHQWALCSSPWSSSSRDLRNKQDTFHSKVPLRIKYLFNDFYLGESASVVKWDLSAQAITPRIGSAGTTPVNFWSSPP